MKSIAAFLIAVVLTVAAAQAMPAKQSPEYARVQANLATGWNNWNTHTMTSQVLLPDGLEISLGIKHVNSGGSDAAFLRTVLLSRPGPDAEEVAPGAHALDGSYTSLVLSWRGYRFKVESAHDGGDVVMLVTPLEKPKAASLPCLAVFSVGMLWNRPGSVHLGDGRIVADLPAGKMIDVFASGTPMRDMSIPVSGPYFALKLDGPAAVGTGKQRDVTAIAAVIAAQRQAYQRKLSQIAAAYGTSKDMVDAMEAINSSVAWNVIYEPQDGRVMIPVSRLWNTMRDGFVMYGWDSMLTAELASAVGGKELAYANVHEMLRAEMPGGFVSQYEKGLGWLAYDRSDPPLASMVILDLYRHYGDRWLLRDSFNTLLDWNRWWSKRRDMKGYLVWGTDSTIVPGQPADANKGKHYGAALESGLDNSPMYDDAVYNAKTGLMELADVGLMSTYVEDCRALADIADVLGRKTEADELRRRAARYGASLQTLWDDKSGIFLNKDLHTGALSHRLSPTNFYPLLAKTANPAEADRMLREHFFNPKEFDGDYGLPSISRDDPAFKDQDYWRGRVWGPMNYLVYLGLKNYDSQAAAEARRKLAGRSLAMFLSEWRQKGHVHENYSALGLDADTAKSTDRFYTWGALMGLIGCLEQQTH